MNPVSISVDIYCKWQEVHPVYRVYINEELLVERNYLWDNASRFVREHMEVFIAPGEHEFRLESSNPTNLLRFSIRNFRVNGTPVVLGPNGRFVVN